MKQQAQILEKKKESVDYERTQMQKERIIQKLKEKGCRITKQRMILLDVILEEPCSCCKEIYYRAVKQDSRIGTATVYRMVNVLEEIGAISRKNMYKVSCMEQCEKEDACTIELEDHTIYHLSAKKWNSVIKAGLKAYGYLEEQNIRMVTMSPCQGH